MSDDIETPEIEVPAAFLKLERLRAKHTRYFAQVRELQYRVNDLREMIAGLLRRNEELRPEVGRVSRLQHAPGTRFASDQIETNERSIAAYRAMLAIAEAEIEDVLALEDEARLFESLRKHMQRDLIAWGLQ